MKTHRSVTGFLFFSVVVLISALASAEVRADNACIACHQRLAPSPGRSHDFREWEKSVHAKKGVACENCHGGDPTEEDTVKAHQKILRPYQAKSPTSYAQIPETCGKCHAPELEEFKKSAHYKELKQGGIAPNCVTCHGSMAIGILEPRQLEQTCSLCHRERSFAKEALVTMNLAGAAVRTWGEKLEEAKKRGQANPAQVAAFEEQKKALSDVRRKWHTFSMNAVFEEAKKVATAARDGRQALQPAKEK